MKIVKGSLKSAIAKLKAIDHPFRFQICQHLIDNGEKTVTDLYIRFRCEQSVMSQHLAILRRGGYLNTRRDGKEIYYSLNNEIDYISGIINDMAKNRKSASIPVHQDIRQGSV